MTASSISAPRHTNAAQRSTPRSRLALLLPGLALTGGLAMVAVELGQLAWLQAHGLSALTLSIVLGMLLGNSLYPRLAFVCAPGVGLSKQTLLRLGIVLYGLRLTLQDIGQLGLAGVLVDASMLCTTFMLACWVGMRWLGLDRKTAMLIGAGSSICGAAAVMAAEPVVGGRAEQVTVAVSTVVVFGTLAMFLYPALYQLNLEHPLITLSAQRFGLLVGSTVHEVAQVIAAAHAVSEEATNTAVVAKLVRVAMLVPFLMLLSAYLSSAHRSGKHPSAHAKGRITIPWFALGLFAVAGFNSLHWLPDSLVSELRDLDTLLLAMAMAALGLSTHVSAIRQAGFKPLLLAGLLFVWLLIGGVAVNAGIMALMA